MHEPARTLVLKDCTAKLATAACIAGWPQNSLNRQTNRQMYPRPKPLSCFPAQLLESLLAPERLALAAEAAADAAYVQRAWPPEAAQRPFIEYLRSQYDATQLRAIEARVPPQLCTRKSSCLCVQTTVSRSMMPCSST